jgi:hypothetical protein
MVADSRPSVAPQGPRARPCFLWSTARSGTNIVTAALVNSPDITCYNENDPKAFEIFLLRDDDTIARILREASTPNVFFKCFGDTPRAPHLMSLFPDARAIYLLREPQDTIASFVQEFGDHMGRLAWSTVFRSHGQGAPIHSFRNGGADAGLLNRYGDTAHNVGAALYIWQHSFFLNYGAGPADRVLLVRYADFTRQPRVVYGRMCEWFGARPDFARLPKLHQGRGSRPEQGSAHPGLIARCEAIYRRICTSDRLTHIPAEALSASVDGTTPRAAA